jgi:hypothetical protein
MGKRGVVGITALVGLLLASCGSSSATNSSGSSTALQRIHAAVGLTEAAGSAHLVTVADTSGPSSPGSSAAGAADHITSVGDIKFDGPDLKLTNTVQSGSTSTSQSTTAIYIGNTIYMNVSSDPRNWVRTPYHQSYAYLGAVQTTALTTTTGPVTVVGTGKVDGQPATNYLVPIPGSTKTVALTNSMNQPYHEQFRIAPFILSAWLDRAGRIVRTQATQETSSSQGSQVVVEHSTTTLSDFGEVVQINAPSTSTGQ